MLTFGDLIKSYTWYSVEMAMSKFYSEKIESTDEYQPVFEQLQLITPISSNITIKLKLDEEVVDVSGYYANPADVDEDGINSLAIEYTPWNQWLGMTIDERALQDFSEPEIIAHCIYEMTYGGMEEEEIQEGLAGIVDSKNKYESLSPEEKKEQTTSMEEMLKILGMDNISKQ